MKNKLSLIFGTLLLIIISSCAGYEPIFNSPTVKFKILNYSLLGNESLAKKIFNNLERISKSAETNDVNLKTVDISINVSKSKTSTLKDSSGKILEYKITLKSVVTILDFNSKNKILDQTFVSSQSYKVQNEYSETLRLEKKSIDDLINKTYQDILLRVSQSI
tara:strand:+ start:593 stop:1081 length:489 start_codon:yes stop_codon:yes gene_type:complete